MYALGMSGLPGLLAIANTMDVPPWQKAATRWWMVQGPAVMTSCETPSWIIANDSLEHGHIGRHPLRI
jgi:hypothetical protein